MRGSNDPSVVVGIGDDAAVVTNNKQCQLVTTTDTMVEGKHFSKQAPAYGVGYKLMASNLSDIAAMGAVPRWATLNLTLARVDEVWLQEFSNGLLECASKHNVTLIGGDTTSGNQLNVSVHLSGEVPNNMAMLRSHAQVNDKIFVTGVIGLAASMLSHLQKQNYSHANLTESQLSALYKPSSRVDLAIELREIAHAAIDISDGLLHELDIVCEASHVGASLQLNSIPVDRDINLQQAITGGEDYELLFTAGHEHIDQIAQLSEKHSCRISEIGEITNTHLIELYQGEQLVPTPKYTGYDHFPKS